MNHEDDARRHTLPPPPPTETSVVILPPRGAGPADVQALALEIARELTLFGSCAFTAKRVAPGSYEVDRVMPASNAQITPDGVLVQRLS